jgi:hypothetical protein
MKPKNRTIAVGLALTAVVIALIIVLRPPQIPTPTPPAPGPASAQPLEVANNIVVGFGKVKDSGTGENGGAVIVFEENHASRIGQIEIAAMLYRLYAKHHLRQIALEGALESNGTLQASWFQSLPDRAAKWDVAVRLLQEGEIGSAEFMALVAPRVSVHGVEKEEEYSVSVSKEAELAPGLYLGAITAKTVSPDQLQAAGSLLQQGRQKEALELIAKSDPWIKQAYLRLTASETSAEDYLILLKDIDEKASHVGASIPDATRSAFRDLQHFFEVASQRSDTMAANTLSLMKGDPNTIVALTVGAAHTSKISRLLSNAHVSYAVVSPESLSENDPTSSLSADASDRKNQGLSVDAPGLLGTILSTPTPRKPPPVLGQAWLQAKADTYYMAIVRARAAAGGEGGGEPPDLPEGHPHFSHECYQEQRDEEGHNEVMFCGDVLDHRIWIRAVQLSPPRPKLMTVALADAREKVRAENNSTDTGSQILELAPGLVAIFSTDEMTVRTARLANADQ